MLTQLFFCCVFLSLASGATLPRAYGDVVFIGDSITAFWAQSGWSIWNNYYAPLGGVNLGVPGDVTQQTIDRINGGNIANMPGKIAVLNIGTNDLGRDLSVDYVAEQIELILNLIKSNLPEVKIILCGILPRNSVEIHEKIRAVNGLISAYDNQNFIRFLDMDVQFSTGLGQIIPGLFEDGVHLTAKGYEIWHAAMMPLFEELINSV